MLERRLRRKSLVMRMSYRGTVDHPAVSETGNSGETSGVEIRADTAI
jgi:hypothetical protein